MRGIGRGPKQSKGPGGGRGGKSFGGRKPMGGRGGRRGGPGGDRGDRGGRGGRGGQERGGRVLRKKVCRFSSGKVPLPDFKDTESLRKFVTEKGKIIPRRITGTSAKYQRRLAAIIKQSRHSGLLSFSSE